MKLYFMNPDLFRKYANFAGGGKFLRHFRNICTIKSFPVKKFERRDDSKLHPCISCWWPLTATKK